MDDPSSERVLGVGELVVFPRKTVHAIPRIVEEPLVFMSIDTPRRIPTASGVEDPERKPAVAAGYRGGRFISVEASTRGEWEAGGSTMAGADGYATSKQCVLAAALALARENPRLHINAVEPGFTPATNLAREAPAPVRFVSKYILTLFAPFVKYWSTPKRAARVITSILTSKLDQTGTYYDDGGQPMLGSVLARDPSFGFRVVTETRALLSTEQLA